MFCSMQIKHRQGDGIALRSVTVRDLTFKSWVSRSSVIKHVSNLSLSF